MNENKQIYINRPFSCDSQTFARLKLLANEEGLTQSSFLRTLINKQYRLVYPPLPAPVSTLSPLGITAADLAIADLASRTVTK